MSPHISSLIIAVSKEKWLCCFFFCFFCNELVFSKIYQRQMETSWAKLTAVPERQPIRNYYLLKRRWCSGRGRGALFALLSALTSALGSVHGVYIYHWVSLAIQTTPRPVFFHWAGGGVINHFDSLSLPSPFWCPVILPSLYFLQHFTFLRALRDFIF